MFVKTPHHSLGGLRLTLPRYLSADGRCGGDVRRRGSDRVIGIVSLRDISRVVSVADLHATEHLMPPGHTPVPRRVRARSPTSRSSWTG